MNGDWKRCEKCRYLFQAQRPECPGCAAKKAREAQEKAEADALEPSRAGQKP